MITRLMLIPLSLFFSLGEPGPDHECKFPGDCLTHDTSRTDLPCERKSDRWQRYQNATPTEQDQMRQKWREPMRDRIIRIYEVDASQENMIREEVEAIYTGHRAGMSAIFEEAKRLDEVMSDYVLVFSKRLRERESDNATVASEAVLRLLRNDPKYQNLLDRRREIEASCQIDWNDALTRIEKLLPEEQVLKGRGQLAVELPHRCCSLWIEDITTNDKKKRDGLESVHPWEAHVARFIDRYHLDSGQIGAAKSILREVRRKAALIDRRRFEELARMHSLGDNAHFRHASKNSSFGRMIYSMN